MPDGYEKYVNGAKSTAPIINPNLIAYGQSSNYNGISNKINIDAKRRQVLNDTIGH